MNIKNISVPFVNFKREYKKIKKEINLAIKEVLEDQAFVLGKRVEEFEKNYSNYLGIRHTIGINSGTDGIILALKALNVGEGDEVITPANSFFATTLGIEQVKATPVFVDIDEETYQIDTNKIEDKITKRTKAILLVHLYGTCANMEDIITIAKKHNIYIIEDACQAHGVEYKGKKAGTLGDISIFSFYPSKNLGAYGDGGAVCTDNEELAVKLKLLRNYGQRVKYYHDILGTNTRLDEIQAAILSVKLKYLDIWNNSRNKIAKRYTKNIKTIKTQTVYKSSTHNYHLYVIEVKNREEFIKYMHNNDINCQIHYPIPLHLQQALKHLGYKEGDFPITENVAKHIVSLPMYPFMTNMEIKKVIDTINTYENL